jgi:hypothetical protein
MCHFNQEYREKRQKCDNINWLEESQDKPVWLLPKDIRTMSIEEIADYQPGQHQRPSKYKPITLREYLNN